MRHPTFTTTNTAQPRAAWGWMLAGMLCGLLTMLCWQLPARWVSPSIASVTHGLLTLQAAHGSIWQGSAQWVIGSTAGANSTPTVALPGRVAWSWGLNWNQGPALSLRLQAECCSTNPVTLQVVWQNSAPVLTVSDMGSADGLRIPANVLTALGAPLNSLQTQGTLFFSSSNLQLPLPPSPVAWRGTWQLDLLDIETSLSTIRPLGSYRIAGSSTQGNSIAVSTISGPLQIQGSGQWQANRLHFQGWAQAAPESEEALNNLLNIIGQRQGSRTLLQLN